MRDGVVLGLDFGGSKTAALVTDPRGSRLGGDVLAVSREHTAQRTLSGGLAMATALLARASPGEPVRAIGASTFGIPSADGIALAPNVPGWEQIALAAELSRTFDCEQVSVITDVKAAAQAEADDGALRGADPGLYLNLGTGLAAAIVVAGRVVRGANGASGEIGYNLRTPDDVARTTHGRALLELAVSGAALDSAIGVVGGVDGAGDGPSSPRAVAIAAMAPELAFHLVNLAIALDPQRIAVGGGMVRSWPLIFPVLRAALDAAVPYPPPLVRAAHPYDAPLLGAVALALRTLLPADQSMPA